MPEMMIRLSKRTIQVINVYTFVVLIFAYGTANYYSSTLIGAVIRHWE